MNDQSENEIPETFNLSINDLAFASIYAYLLKHHEPQSNPIWETVKGLETDVKRLTDENNEMSAELSRFYDDYGMYEEWNL